MRAKGISFYKNQTIEATALSNRANLQTFGKFLSEANDSDKIFENQRYKNEYLY